MKKLSALIAMLLCVTIGGVYAAWTYTKGSTDITDSDKAFLISLSTATEEGAHGVYTIETNIAGFSIDQNGQSDLSQPFHKAVMNTITSDGQAPYITIKLTLADNAPAANEVFADVETTYDVHFMDVINNQFGGETIFQDLKNGAQYINKNDGANNWSKEDPSSDRVWIYTINLEDEFTFGNFVLDSKTDHTLFGEALGKGAILHIDVSDGITPSSN